MDTTEQLTRITKDSGVASDMMLTSKVAFDLDLADADAVQSIGDKYAKGSALAKLEMNEINESTKIAQGTFKSMNMTADDSISAITLLANAGYVGSSAGTMMNATYNDLISKSEDGKLAIGNFAMSLYDAEGRMKTMPKIMEEIEKGTANMSEEQRNAALAATFGANSQKLVNAFLNQGSEAYKSYASEISGAEGDLQAKYDETGKTRAEQWAKTKSSLVDIVGTLGDAMMPAIDKAIGLVEKFADWFGGLDKETQEFIGTAILATAALSPMLGIGSKIFGVFGKASGGISKFIGILGKLPGLPSKIALGFSSAAGKIISIGSKVGAVAFNPIVLGIAGAVAAGVLIYKNWDKIKEKASELSAKVSESWDNIVSNTTEFKDSVIESFSSTVNNVKEDWASLRSSVEETIDGKVELLKDKFDSGVNWVKDKWQGLKSFLKNPIKGTVDIARNAVSKAKNIGSTKRASVNGSHASGLDNVPFDGYIGELHQDEMVLTKDNARQFRALGGTSRSLPNPNSIVSNRNLMRKNNPQNIQFNPSINIEVKGNATEETATDISNEVVKVMNREFKKLLLQMS